MARVPVIRVGNTLIASVQEDLRDRDAVELQTNLTEQLERTSALGVLLDMSVVETIDSFLGRMMHDVVRVSRLLGAETVVVGLQPAVAVTLVELGLELRGVHTALTADKGMLLLRKLTHEERRNGRRRTR